MRDKVYSIQGSSVVKFIAIDLWVKDQLSPLEGHFETVDNLYTAYESWVRTKPEWEPSVIDNRIGFVQKMTQLLIARGWSCHSDRASGGRGYRGLILNHVQNTRILSQLGEP